MMPGAGGAMRATGWRATAIGFNNSVRGALMASLAERRASPWTATSIRDRPAGCPTGGSSLCGAVCGNGPVAGSRRRWFVGADRMAARIRRRAGDDGAKAQRRNQTRHSPPPSDIRVVLGWWTLTALGLARAPKRWWRLAALKDQRKTPLVHLNGSPLCRKACRH